MNKNIITLILTFSAYLLQANVVDSLNLKLSTIQNDTNKIMLCINTLKNKNLDINDKKIVIDKLEKLIDNIYTKYIDDTSKSYYYKYINIYKHIAVFYQEKYYDNKKFLDVSNKLLKIYTLKKDTNSIASLYNRIGNFYKFKSDYEKALKYYLKSLDINKKINNKRGVAYAHIGIANVFINWKKYNEAISNYQKCLNLSKQISDTIGMAAAYTGMGNIYFQLDNLPEALKNHKKAYHLYSESKDYEGVALSLLNLADIYTKTKESAKALKVYNEALKISLQNNFYVRAAYIYNKIADIYYNDKNYNLAIKYYNKSMVYSKQIDYVKLIIESYKGLAYSYKQTNKLSEAYNYIEKYHSLKDSVFNYEKHKQLAEIEAKYKTAEKEKLIKQQKFKIEKNKLINQTRTKQRNLVLVILLLVIFLLIFVVKGYRNKRKANKLLTQQNEEISAQRDEIKEQKSKIEEILREVHQSIDYATKIQAAILPDFNILNEKVTEYFVFFNPKDKVSGDFYWWTHIENHTIITVADCTGHGVPGAFMSMLGVSLLREIVEKEYITNTGVILRKLRKEIIKSLKQKGKTGEQKDGMDMAIISINHETNTVQFSGANNPLYLITNEELRMKNEENTSSVKFYDNSEFKIQNSKFRFYEVKPNKMPIAIYEKMDNFTTHEFQLQKGDQLYMFSDGFADQFGGPKGKKIKYKPFKRLLLENADKPMNEQKETLEKTFSKWIEGYEQIDDVTVLGIKL